MNLEVVKPLVKGILEASLCEAKKGNPGPYPFEWTLQGLGMLRTYFGQSLRLHVWDSRYSVGASEMHTHPWDMESFVVVGGITNIRYGPGLDEIPNFWEQKIKCGAGGGLEGSPKKVSLREFSPQLIKPGETYKQEAWEIHTSHPHDGTVTLVQRTFKDDVDRAYVYWPLNQEWISAEPRSATPDEVAAILSWSLEEWFS